MKASALIIFLIPSAAMKRMFLMIGLTVTSLAASGQMILGRAGLQDNYIRYHFDTLKIIKDTTFVKVKLFEYQILVEEEDMMFYGGKHISHGHSVLYYKTGQKKREGTFLYGIEQNDWKYWDESGNIISEEKYKSILRQHQKAIEPYLYDPTKKK